MLYLLALGATIWSTWDFISSGSIRVVEHLTTLCNAAGTTDCGYAPAYWTIIMGSIHGALACALSLTIALILITAHRHVIKDYKGRDCYGPRMLVFLTITIVCLLVSFFADHLAYDKLVGMTPDGPAVSVNDGTDPSLQTPRYSSSCPNGYYPFHGPDGSTACFSNSSLDKGSYDYGLPGSYDSQAVEAEISGVMVNDAACPSSYAFIGEDQAERCIAPMK